jgi:adenine-specific DNA-methyltransferase
MRIVPLSKKLRIKSVLGSADTNYLINGENLIVLSDLKFQLENKLDLIYIDPPYNTGKVMGKYNDNFRSHHEWLDFMKPRLELAHLMLKESGIIFISIGELEEAHLKLLCNDIFGEDNKVASIIWQCKYTVSNDKSGITNQTEYILVYAKNANKITINNDPLRTEYVDKTYKNPDNDSRGLWRGGVQLYKKKNKKSYTVKSPAGKEWTMPWNYSEEQWKNVLEKNDIIYWGADGNSCPVKKVFLKDTKGAGIRNLWLGEDVGYTADGGNVLENMFGDRNSFLYPKPVSLMKRIIQIATQRDSITMDFFAGSGTFGQAILEANRDDVGNRQFIMITNDENGICELARSRMAFVINGYTGQKDEKPYEGTGSGMTYMVYEDK